MDATTISLRRRSLLAGAGAVGIAALAPSAAKAQAATPLRFGLAMPLTGSQATYGQDQVRAAQWAVDEINKAGGHAQAEVIDAFGHACWHDAYGSDEMFQFILSTRRSTGVAHDGAAKGNQPG